MRRDYYVSDFNRWEAIWVKKVAVQNWYLYGISTDCQLFVKPKILGDWFLFELQALKYIHITVQPTEDQELREIWIYNREFLDNLKDQYYIRGRSYRDYFITDNNYLLDLRNGMAVKLRQKIKDYRILKWVEMTRDKTYLNDSDYSLEVIKNLPFTNEKVDLKDFYEFNGDSWYLNLEKLQKKIGYEMDLVLFKYNNTEDRWKKIKTVLEF